MKMKRTGSVLTAILLLLALLPGRAALALGTEDYASSIPLGEGTVLHETVYQYEGRQDEHYIEYTPNDLVRPLVVYGSKLLNYGRFDSMAELVEADGRTVLGGTNGDFYVVSSYQPIGLVVTEGIIRSSDGGVSAVGFRGDGTAILGKPGMSAGVTLGGRSYRVYGINKAIADSDFYLYTEDYSYTTRFGEPTISLILSFPEDYELRFNTETELVVEDIVESEGAFDLPEGKLVLSLTQDSDDWRMEGIRSVQVGDKVPFFIRADETWDEVEYALGGLYRILADGEIQPDIDDKQTAPRTAVGQRPDGSLIFYTVDGRQSGYSVGLKVSEVAQRLLELGCVDACLMDGGGSTNLHARYVGDESASQVNVPSGFSERSVTNYVMLAAMAPGSGELHTLAVYPNDPVVLAGSAVRFTARGADEAGMPVAVPAPNWAVQGAGTVDGEGNYLSREKGIDRVSAAVDGCTDTAKILVIDSPDAMTIRREGSDAELKNLALLNGEKVQLAASCSFRGIDVISDPEAYTWSVSEGLGSIDEKGLFTAGEEKLRGQITVTAGSFSRTVEVSVGAEYRLAEGFENAAPAGDGLSMETGKDHVRYGSKSLKISFDGAEGARSVYSLPMTFPSMARYLSLWISGDGTDCGLSLLFADGSELALGSFGSREWQQLVLPLGQQREIVGFAVSAENAGNLWLDQFVVSTSPEADLTAPELELRYADLELRAALTDDCGKVLRQNVSVRYDGVEIEFAYDETSGALLVPARSLEPGHRITVRAMDASGNLASAAMTLPWPEPVDEPEPPEGEEPPETEELPTPEPLPFTDTQGHWAEEYVRYMYGQGVVNGVTEDRFDPNSSVTRAQCAVMIARWLRLDTSLYADTALSFTDLGEIPAWALDAVKAVYSLGIITGVQQGEGVAFAPASPLTREQAMTIIGRIEERGYTRADLSVFADADKVQSWSRSYLTELVGRGVISGYDDGTLRPADPVTRAQIAKILTEVR